MMPYEDDNGVAVRRAIIEVVVDCTCDTEDDDGECMRLWAAARWPNPQPQHDLDEEDPIAAAGRAYALEHV